MIEDTVIALAILAGCATALAVAADRWLTRKLGPPIDRVLQEEFDDAAEEFR